MDVSLPPWDRHVLFRLELCPTVDFRTAKAFVSHLQLSLPGGPNALLVQSQPRCTHVAMN